MSPVYTHATLGKLGTRTQLSGAQFTKHTSSDHTPNKIQLVVERLAPEGPRHYNGCAANSQLAWRDLGSLHAVGDGGQHPGVDPVGRQAEIGGHTGLCHLDNNNP